MKYPDVIFATEKIGSNGIRCLDYKNKDDDVEYIRADLVKLQNTSSNSDHTNCPYWKVYNKGGSGEFGVCDCQGRLK